MPVKARPEKAGRKELVASFPASRGKIRFPAPKNMAKMANPPVRTAITFFKPAPDNLIITF
ncbi:hypothetical protein QM565_23455 [Geitlerinema splendidum]|nr:hypothetical protein [Geitlerinema splendidum]